MLIGATEHDGPPGPSAPLWPRTQSQPEGAAIVSEVCALCVFVCGRGTHAARDESKSPNETGTGVQIAPT